MAENNHLESICIGVYLSPALEGTFKSAIVHDRIKGSGKRNCKLTCTNRGYKHGLRLR